MKNISHFYKSYKKTVRSIGIWMLLFVGIFVVVDYSTTYAGYDPSICASVTEIPVSECEALVALYNSTDGDNWNNTTNRWNPVLICGSRYGVTCADGHVSQINLWGNGLSWALLSEISNLTALTNFNLENNYISSLPTELGNIITLTSLSLAASSLSSLPETLTGLINLTPGNLSVWYNKLTPNVMSNDLQTFLDTNAEWGRRDTQNMVDPTVARAALMALYNATDSANRWRSDNRDTWTPICNRWGITCDGYQSIIRIDLSNNNLSWPIPYEFGDLTKLTTINFENNQISDMWNWIGNLVNLTGMNIKNNLLSWALPIEIGNLTNLITLDLEDNDITSVPTEIGNLANLTFLGLWRNKITSLPESLTGLINLAPWTLTITYNKLNPITLSNDLQTFLDTNAEWGRRDTQNMVDPTVARAALMALYNATDSANRWRSDNRDTWTPICNRWGITCDGYQSIIRIDLSNNNLSWPIPYEFGDLTKLTTINFENNQISDLGSGFVNLVNLTGINLDNNGLTALPSDIGNLIGLTTISIRRNAITSLPESFTGLINLEIWSLAVWYNKLWPNSMSNELLTLLDTKAEADRKDTQNMVNAAVARNALMALYNATNGEGWNNNDNRDTLVNICNRWGITCDVYQSIVSINLSNNNLEWVIPYEFGDLTKLISLNLSYNGNLSGISSGIANLLNLTNLNLENDTLNVLPDEIGNLLNLTWLNVRWNLLTYLPDTIGNLTDLIMLDVRQNGLTTLPASMTGLANLETWSLFVGANNLDSDDMSNDVITLLDTKAEADRRDTQNMVDSAVARAALMALYNATDGVNRWRSDNRDTWAPICNRWGITCDAYQSIVSIDLSNNGLNGIIPYEFSNLTKLTSLNLSNNSITDISSGVANLIYLRNLNLERNWLTSIPDELWTLRRMTGLNIRYNGLTTLPGSLTGLINLETWGLFVWYNYMSDTSSMSAELLNFINAKAEDNRQTTQNISQSTTRAALIALYTATDGDNWINKDNRWVGSYCSRRGIICDGNNDVTSISLGGNNLVGDIPADISQLIKLSYIDIGINNITSIPDEITNLPLLNVLYLQQNNISSLPNAIGNLTGMTILYLSNNALTSFPESLTGLINITPGSLSVWNNHIIDTSSMSPELLNFINTNAEVDRQTTQSVSPIVTRAALMALYNATDGDNWINKDNRWVGSYCTRYGIACDVNNDITAINLPSNNLSWIIPDEVTNLIRLTNVDLNGNSIISLPSQIGSLHGLISLNLSYNSISSLPDSITDLSWLISLYLSHNVIPSLPDAIGNLTNLSSLSLDNNHLSVLPPSLTQLINMGAGNLTIWRNHINGSRLNADIKNYLDSHDTREWEKNQTVPSDAVYNALIALYNATDGPHWASQTNRLNTGVSYCDREGIMCSSLQTIIWISLPSYHLSGDIPPEIWDIFTLEMLSLGDNLLLNIPSSISNLWYLNLLYLQDNQLTSLPESFAQLTAITDGNLFIMSNYLDRNTMSETLRDFIDQKAWLWWETSQLRYSYLDILTDLYNDTDGDLRTNNANWGNRDYSYCDRYGITCNESNVIIQINLPGNNLSWTIPASISGLEDLVVFDIGSNQVTSLPDSLTSLIHIGDSNLFVGNNRLNRNEMSAELKTFVDQKAWSWWRFTQTPPVEQNYTVLMALYNSTDGPSRSIQTNRMDTGVSYCDRFGVMCDGANTVVQLNLGNNNLSWSIPADIGDLTPLTQLILSNNMIVSLPNSMTGLVNIPAQSLYIDSNKLCTGDMDTGLLSFLNNTAEADWQSTQDTSSCIFYDTTPPVGTISFNPDSGTVTSGSVVATISLDETGTITNNWWLTGYIFTGNGTFTFEFQDLAWNTWSATATVNRIDKTAPTATITYSPTSWSNTSGDVVVTITLDETGTITNNWWLTWYIFTGNGTFTFEFQDLAWNTWSATATVTRIDKTLQTDTGGWPTYIPSKTTTWLLCTSFSSELNGAYTFAFINGITTIKDCTQANLEWTLQRSHLAKMISQFAVKVMNIKPDTSKSCDFSDIESETKEIQLYIKVACQLGLMGYDDNGNQNKTFDPFATVNRAQFGTILSRVLRGTKYNGADPYYLNHLNALKTEWIMTNISQPLVPEMRWRVMLMLQRIGK